MAGQQLGERAIQELAEDMPPIGSKGVEPPAFLPVFCAGMLILVFDNPKEPPCGSPW